jgi:excisionase family DNA binding protein
MAPTSLLSVEQVAEILKLNVRTIRNYVRSGALKATRIGKQYRIALADLEVFTGQPVESLDDRILGRGGRVEVSGVINVAGVTPALATRLTNTLMATAKGPPGRAEPLAISTTYEVEHDRLRILVAADLPTMRSMLALIDAVLERSAAAA